MSHGKTEKVAPEMSDTLLSNENMIVDVEMIDGDNCCGVEEQFAMGASLEEGISGSKPIDTLYENTSMDTVNVPRSTLQDEAIKGRMPNHEGVNNPAPVSANPGMYPHRRY